MKRCIRVAQILNRMDSGGIEAVLLNYYRHIKRDKVQFDFFCDESSKMPFREEIIRMGAEIHLLPPYTNQKAYQNLLERQLKAGKYDIVHVHMNTMSVFALAAAKRAGMPVRICHNHSTADWKEGKKTALKYLLRPWNCIPATDWFACGQMAGEWMYGKKAMKEGKVFILPNAIDTEKFRYSSKTRAAVRQEFGIPERTFVVGHIGRFMRQKNHTGLLKIFGRLYEEQEDAMLLLVGEGELEEDIRKLAKEMRMEDKVVFAGARKDIQRIYSAMDVFCLPSLYEGFPVVLLEAQANGLPVVCADNVTPEVCLTGLVERLPLDEETIWVRAMLTTRRENVALPEEYNIRSAARLLMEKYKQLIIDRTSVRRGIDQLDSE